MTRRTTPRLAFVAAVTAFLMAFGGIALAADTLAGDGFLGDGLFVANPSGNVPNQDLSVGSLCPGASYNTPNAAVNAHLAAKSGGDATGTQNTWVNSAALTVSVGTITQSASGTTAAGTISAAMDETGITLPADWESKAAGFVYTTDTSAAEISLVAGTTAGNYSGKVQFLGSGAGYVKVGNNVVSGTVERPHDIDVTWTVLQATDPACVSAPVNAPPTADAGGPYTGNEGAQIQLDGSGSSDDGTIASYSWSVTAQSGGSNDPDDGATCSFVDGTTGADQNPKVSCTDDGVYDVDLTVTDDAAVSDSDSTTLTLSNAAPTFDSGNPAFASTTVSCANRTVTLNFAFSDAGSNDSHTASISWGDGSPTQNLTAAQTASESATHTYNSGGPYTATVTVTDDDGGSTGAVNSTNTLTVNYNMSSILQPINDTRNGQPASLFKYGSTVPVKVIVTDCDGATPTGLVLKVTWRQGLNATPTGVDEVVPTSQADLGNTMRYSDGQYVLQLNSKNTTSDSTCGITIWVTIQSTGQSVSANIGFRK